MYSINRSALVPYSAKQMYDLVNDVDAYQLFLPWCGDSKVLERRDDEIIASITIAFKGLDKTFTTCNTLEPDTQMQMQLVDGPFSELSGSWDFKELDEQACKISLDLQFGFSNALIGAVVGPIFSKIADSMVESFTRRAEDVYGNKS